MAVSARAEASRMLPTQLTSFVGRQRTTIRHRLEREPFAAAIADGRGLTDRVADVGR
jgi:hypothetical protein